METYHMGTDLGAYWNMKHGKVTDFCGCKHGEEGKDGTFGELKLRLTMSREGRHRKPLGAPWVI